MKKVFAIIIVAMLVAFPVVAEVMPETEIAAPVITVDLTQIVVSVIGLLFSFVLTWLIRAVVPPVKAWLETRTTAQQRDMLNTLVMQLVHAAEQTIGAGKGKQKLDYVCNQLRKRGYTVDMDIIEATVKEMNDGMLEEIFVGEEVNK